MGLPIVENLSGLCGNIFGLFRRPNSILVKNPKKIANYIKLTDFPLFPLFGVPWAAVINIIGLCLHSMSHCSLSRCFQELWRTVKTPWQDRVSDVNWRRCSCCAGCSLCGRPKRLASAPRIVLALTMLLPVRPHKDFSWVIPHW